MTDKSAEIGEEKISQLERRIGELTAELGALRKAKSGTPVPNYTFDTLSGETTLLDLFGESDQLLVIHNMGQGCRYCTLWADGFNGLLGHLEAALAVVLVSKDPPALQRTFAQSRGWRFRLASHGGGDYIREQGVYGQAENYPGAVVYERKGPVDGEPSLTSPGLGRRGTILRKNACAFGPGDLYCALWGLLGLAGLDEQEFTPQFNYWTRPAELDDGGQNVL